MEHYFTDSNAKSNLKEIKIKILNENFIFNTDNGVFSKKGLDFGSRLLINNLIKEKLTGKILEIGCGYGVISIVLNKMLGVLVDAVDVNKRAIHLSTMNSKLNKCSDVNIFYSDCYSGVCDKYDYIITNPPIRAGKKIVYKMLFEAKEHLKDKGALYFVMRKEQGALSTVNDLKKISDVLVLEKTKGYLIIKCVFY